MLDLLPLLPLLVLIVTAWLLSVSFSAFVNLSCPWLSQALNTIRSVMPWVINLWLVSSSLPQSVCRAHSSRCPDNWSNPPLFRATLWAVRLAWGAVVFCVITLPAWIPGAPLCLLQIPHHLERCFCACLSAKSFCGLSSWAGFHDVLPWPWEEPLALTERADRLTEAAVRGSWVGHWREWSSLRLGEVEIHYRGGGVMFLRELEGKDRKGISLDRRQAHWTSLTCVHRRALRLRGSLNHCLLQLPSQCQPWDTFS